MSCSFVLPVSFQKPPPPTLEKKNVPRNRNQVRGEQVLVGRLELHVLQRLLETGELLLLALRRLDIPPKIEFIDMLKWQLLQDSEGLVLGCIEADFCE